MNPVKFAEHRVYKDNSQLSLEAWDKHPGCGPGWSIKGIIGNEQVSSNATAQNALDAVEKAQSMALAFETIYGLERVTHKA